MTTCSEPPRRLAGKLYIRCSGTGKLLYPDNGACHKCNGLGHTVARDWAIGGRCTPDATSTAIDLADDEPCTREAFLTALRQRLKAKAAMFARMYGASEATIERNGKVLR